MWRANFQERSKKSGASLRRLLHIFLILSDPLQFSLLMDSRMWSMLTLE